MGVAFHAIQVLTLIRWVAMVPGDCIAHTFRSCPFLHVFLNSITISTEFYCTLFIVSVMAKEISTQTLLKQEWISCKILKHTGNQNSIISIYAVIKDNGIPLFFTYMFQKCADIRDKERECPTLRKPYLLMPGCINGILLLIS